MQADPTQIDRRVLLQNALVTIDKLQAKLDAVEQARHEPIAIIGLSCRFPGGANSPEAYWKLLEAGQDAIKEVPPERWNVADYAGLLPEGTTWYGGFLDQVDQFDPQFFGIAPREAETMDPQQRLILEVSWEALERAGQAPDKLKGSQTGIFVGITTNDYFQLAKLNGPAQMDVYTATGSALNVAPGRVAYTLGFQGPSVAVDTACSSSLVAVHLACQSLRNGETDLALAGGVNVLLTPEPFICFSRWGMMAPDGRCKTFDATADGFVRSEGCGVIVLKRLSDAVAAGDNILALIRGSAVNQDGRSSGLTVPNGLSQEAVVRQALASARLRPADVSYVETHGTGTSLGDPIEIEALGAALGEDRPSDRPLFLASVKTNIGHLESASGIAGLIKVVLSMQHQTVPAHLHFQERSPRIPWPTFPVIIPTEPTPWSVQQGTRIAGVSSFGFSGTNAHVILEEAPISEPKTLDIDRPSHLLTLSAKSEPALRQLAAQFAGHLAAQPSLSAADVAYTANKGRAQLNHRLVVVADSATQMQERLAGWAAGQSPAGVSSQNATANRPKIAFLFTGQGAQYVQMGRQLYETQPTFRQTLERCDEILRPYLDQPLLSILYPDLYPPEDQSKIKNLKSKIDETGYTQPALFALEYALAELWRSWGIVPSAVLGHSVGEYVAACLAGVFSLEDGLKLIAERARLMQALPAGGEMAAIFADQDQVTRAIQPYQDKVSIAAINSVQSIVISGAGEAVQTILTTLAEQGIKSQRLTVSHAFHSPLMEPMLDAFTRVAVSVRYATPQIDLISNLTGELATEEITTAAYWRQHVRAPVRFAESIRFLKRQGYNLFIEIGPKPTLLSLGQRCWSEDAESVEVAAKWLPSLRPGRADWQQILESLGELYLSGVEIDWTGFERDYRQGRQRMMLPTYPFQRQRYWLPQPKSQPNYSMSRRQEKAVHPLLGQPLRSPLLKEKVFEAQVSVQWPTFLNDHRIYQTPLFPATGYLEMAAAAAKALFGVTSPLLQGVWIQEALVLPEEGEQTIQIAISPAVDNSAAFQIFSQEGMEENWKLHAAGKIRLGQELLAPEPVSPDEIQLRCSETVPADDYYRRLTGLGLTFGPGFQGVKQIWRQDGEALGQVELPEPLASTGDDYLFHPALLDACFHLLGVAIPKNGQATGEQPIYVPVGLNSYRIYQAGCRQVWGQAVIHLQAGASLAESASGDIRLFDLAGQPIAEVNGLQLRRVNQELIRQISRKSLDHWLYRLEWQPQELEPQAARPAEPGSWLIFADQKEVGQALAARLVAQGDTCLLVRPGDRYQAIGPDGWQIDPASPEDFQRLVAEAGKNDLYSFRGAIHLWSLDMPQDVPVMSAAQALGSGSVVNLVQALVTAESLSTGQARLWLVTQGAQPVGLAGTLPTVAQMPLWGLGRTIAVEHPALQCTCVDLDPADDGAQPALFEQVWKADGENQIVLRQNKRYVARLVRQSQAAAQEPVELAIATPGLLDSLTLQPSQRRQPEPAEVEIRVRATGLNFRDVLNGLGMYPGPAIPFGSECSGIVVAVGSEVTNIAVGDEVIALVGGSFSSFVTAAADQVFKKPANLSFAEAATLPTPFLTAYYGLHHLAGLKRGDRVLIHAAAGGVGLAAVQLAQQAGAEIFGTAGSPEKRDFLKSIDVQHVLDSRTLDFADEIMRITGGAGVNIVLNSLANEFIPKSLAILADGGHFLELGKRDTWDEGQVAQLNPTLSYHRYDLAAVMQADPGLIRSMLNRLLAECETASLKPLPLMLFPLEEAAEAFQYMARARHIGKVVVTQTDDTFTIAPDLSIKDQATYLITGGLGGLGLVVARWLVEQGARHLVLMSRSGAHEASREAVAELEQAGAQVVIAQADVAQQEQVARVLAGIEQEMPPLRGIIHAAGVLDDGLLLQQNWTRFEKVMGPKVDGSWHLHGLTQHLPLDFFVLFSAGAALLGSPGQSNYAAANAFLDGLAHYRRRKGLPALSINWGAWTEVGMAAGLDPHSRERWTAQGIEWITPKDGVEVLERLLRQKLTQVAVLPMNWAKFAQQLDQAGGQPCLKQLIDEARIKMVEPEAPAVEVNLTQQLAQLPPSEQYGLLLSHVQEQVSRVLGLDPAQPLNPRQGLTDLGMDSLMAVEISRRLQKSLGVALPTTLAFEYGAIEAMTRHLMNDVLQLKSDQQTAKVEAKGDEMAELMAELEGISETELEDAILKELENAGY